MRIVQYFEGTKCSFPSSRNTIGEEEPPEITHQTFIVLHFLSFILLSMSRVIAAEVQVQLYSVGGVRGSLQKQLNLFLYCIYFFI